MRLRNIKGANEVIEKSNYFLASPTEYKGKYNKLFNNNNLLHIEIGMGKGDFIIGMALQNPDVNFIGIEKFDSVLVKAVEKLVGLEISNLKLIRMDALDILDVFNKEVDVVYLNFSDPWPKNRHEHRRLSSNIFLDKYEKIFRRTKEIIMKTDNRKLFEYSIMSFVSFGYKIDEISLDYHKDDMSGNVETEYERKFSSLGNPIYRIKVTK